MKVFMTFFLLTAIACSLQFYFDDAATSETITTLTMPITISILLILIYFFSPPKTQHRKIFGVLLIICSIFLVFLFVIFCYVVQLGKAFSH